MEQNLFLIEVRLYTFRSPQDLLCRHPHLLIIIGVADVVIELNTKIIM